VTYGLFQVPVIAVFTKFDQFKRNIEIKLEDEGRASGKLHLSFLTLSHLNDFWLRHDKIKYFIMAFSVIFLLI
jgi:hypothetical protein